MKIILRCYLAIIRGKGLISSNLWPEKLSGSQGVAGSGGWGRGGGGCFQGCPASLMGSQASASVGPGSVSHTFLYSWAAWRKACHHHGLRKRHFCQSRSLLISYLLIYTPFTTSAILTITPNQECPGRNHSARLAYPSSIPLVALLWRLSLPECASCVLCWA